MTDEAPREVTAANGRAVELCRERVIRASEIRGQIGAIWGEYIDRYPRRFLAIPADDTGGWTLVLRTVEHMPTRLSILFGEWLYELRAALDGIVYHLAVQDSVQNPPPAERSLMFPRSTIRRSSTTRATAAG